MLRRPRISTLFPYTTLFRSQRRAQHQARQRVHLHDLDARGAGPHATHETLGVHRRLRVDQRDRKSTRLNSSHANTSYAVLCLKKKTAITVPIKLLVTPQSMS